MFTIGLKLLRQGLELLSRHLTDPALDRALRLVNSYGNAADSSKPYTTFLARNPYEPLAQPIVGVPGQRTHIYWLSSLALGGSPFPPESAAATSAMQRRNVFVEPIGPRGWQVAWTTTSGAESAQFDAKHGAITFARSQAEEFAPSRLVVYKGDLTTDHVTTFDTLQDDLDGGPADQTVRFAKDGTEYEIDLSNENAQALRRELAPYIANARRVRRVQPRRGLRAAASRERSEAVRAWAKAQGISVSARGRIPAEIAQQYERAT
jgi:hypothetical protein